MQCWSITRSQQLGHNQLVATKPAACSAQVPPPLGTLPVRFLFRIKAEPTPGFAASYPRISDNYGKELEREMDYLFIHLLIYFRWHNTKNYLAFIYFILYFKRERNAEYDRKTPRTTVKHGLLCFGATEGTGWLHHIEGQTGLAP